MKIVIFLIATVAVFTKCDPKECQFGGAYDFEIPASLLPMQDTFGIGDTITIVSSFSDDVYEHQTDRKYQLVDFAFFPATLIKKISINPAIDAVDDFEVLIDSLTNYSIVKYSGGINIIEGEYKYEQNRYFLEFQLVAKEKGLFYLEQGVDISFIKNQEFEGKCKDDANDGRVNMNNGAINNIDMLKESPDPHYREWFFGNPKERFYKFGGYCFYVK